MPAANLETGHGQALAASFRDPGGCLFAREGRILRIVNAAGEADLNAFLHSRTGRRLIDSGCVVASSRLSGAEVAELRADPAVDQLFVESGGRLMIEHERIPFPSFPYEWPTEMLHSAALLTLRLARELLPENLGLKDGTPFNVLFRGPEPVFIDVLSFERRAPGDATWLAYAQFVRTFLLPILAEKEFGLDPSRTLAASREGVAPEEFARWLSPLRKLRPPFLSLVSMPVWLGARHREDDTGVYQKKTLRDPERARFVLGSLLSRLDRTLRRLELRKGRHSTWSGYMTSMTHYSCGTFGTKEEFVGQALEEFTPSCVLDVGANTGHFSLMAAERGASVVAIDSDAASVGELWRLAKARNSDVLPLVVNLACPTPATGWRNGECASFLDRARGAFDAVFFLAVVHHLLVTERVPLAWIVEMAADLTTDLAVIEFVAADDPMFQRLTRGRDALHEGLNAEVFEAAARRRFDIVRSRALEGTSRRMYLLRKRA